MEFKTLENCSVTEIATTFNKAFSDYFIPIQLTTDQLNAKMIVDKTERAISIGAFDNDKLVALMLHGKDIINGETIAYNSGTGVIPEYRGNGLTKEMYKRLEQRLEHHNISKIVLEVISENIQAIKSYEKSGFQIKRELACFKGHPKSIKPSWNLKSIDLTAQNWKLMQSFWNIEPTWQNSINVLNTIKDTISALGAYSDEQLVGYCIYDPNTKRIHQIAVKKEYRQQGIGTSFVSSISVDYEQVISIINVDRISRATFNFFEGLGMENNFNQFEMIKSL
ncbi:GNAT family N-acetyltransferase [Winogradskyella poriferorum]|uniref:GNAT family N-acetyltransferase n=1 Tax=Winogradskyella poriferorum TaxID=307627 RepID=UPI003D648EF1